ncbi:MAG: signal peptidase I [Actinobacteria bacterium]|nr:signal peptidase I [Actinomycetota bacterium]
MAPPADTSRGLREPVEGTRRPRRVVGLVTSSIGVLVYSACLWLLAFALLPMAFRWSPTVVGSDSMSPVVREGDVVLTSPHDGVGLGPGAVILFQSDTTRTPVMHRIVAVNPDGTYLTKGDANPGADSTPVDPSDIKGVARALVPYAGLPAHWLRAGNWPGLAGFLALLSLSVWLGHRRPGLVEADAPPRHGFRRWAVVGAVSVVLLGATAATALASFSAPTVSPANLLASGTWHSVVDVAAGEEHSCAVLGDGTAWCWGENGKGQLGDGTTTDRTTATRVAGPGGSGHLSGVAGITAGREQTCAFLGDGSAYCWGENGNGQVGDGTTTDRHSPTRVGGVGGAGYLAGVVGMDAGRDHSCARLSDGTMACWGDNDEGQLGDGTWHDRRTPVRVVGSDGSGVFASVTMIGVGFQHSCVVRADTTAWCWGEGSRHRLGNGSTSDRNRPTQVRGPGGSGYLTGVAGISGGDQHSCAVLAAGTAWCWGRNDEGQLGIGTTSNENYPVQVDGRDGSGTLADVAGVSSGRDHTCARHGDGSVSCWGLNNAGQLGDATTIDRLSPVAVAGPGGVGQLPNAFLLSVDWHHACAAASVDEVWCWGRNDRGQLGDGTYINRTWPARTIGL